MRANAGREPVSPVIPDYLRDCKAIAVACLAPDGSLTEANHGFLRAAGAPGPAWDVTGWNAAGAFIWPTFADLVSRRTQVDGEPIFRGVLNLGSPGVVAASLTGSAYRCGEGILVVAEQDPEESDRLRDSVLSLNRDLAETQRQLVRDIQSRRRAESELAETNRGILALYAELEDKAVALGRASELKSRFLSNMTHEFRTPLNAILSLTRILLDGMDGDLTPAQSTEVSYIRASAETLSELVDNLLDLARLEAGKSTVRSQPFAVADLFAALRGMMRPLIRSADVAIVFGDPRGIPTLRTDQGKVAQVLRNLLSNAIKFTERGEIRVTAEMDGPSTVVFTVADTGIGIAESDQEHVFNEYAQVDHPLQSRFKGTGLGLPVSRHLARLLGGDVSLTSQPGVGSTFRFRLPVEYADPSTAAAHRDEHAGAHS